MHSAARATLALAAAAAIAATQQQATLRLRLTDGQQIKFASTTKTESETLGIAGSNTLTMTQTAQVTAQRDGWSTVRITHLDVKVEGDGMMGLEPVIQKGLADAAIRLEVDERGKTRNVALENVQAVDPVARDMYIASLKSDQVAGFMGIHFPADPVKIGSTWAIEIDAAQIFEFDGLVKAATGKTPVSYEVVAFESVNGKPAAKIESRLSGTLKITIDPGTGMMQGTSTLSGTITNWVELATGILIKSTGTATVVTELEIGQVTEKVTVNIERVP